MSQPLHNPFYFLLLFACALLLITMFIYLFGWLSLAGQGPLVPAPMPPWLRWIDRNALFLIAGEVVAIIILSGLTIGLDRFFERRPMSESDSLPGDDR